MERIDLWNKSLYKMDRHLILENQLKQVNLIITSTNDLLFNIKGKDDIDPRIIETVGQIISFIHKIVQLVPEVLISEKHTSIIKKDIVDSFQQVLDLWPDFTQSGENFIEAWRQFTETWDRFNTSIDKINKSGNTIILSMN